MHCSCQRAFDRGANDGKRGPRMHSTVRMVDRPDAIRSSSLLSCYAAVLIPHCVDQEKNGVHRTARPVGRQYSTVLYTVRHCWQTGLQSFGTTVPTHTMCSPGAVTLPLAWPFRHMHSGVRAFEASLALSRRSTVYMYT